MECIEILKREHSVVRLVTAAARRDLAEEAATHSLALEEIEKLIDFFRYFANSCHDPKEEDLLFAMLHRRGMAWDAYPLRGLVQDHEEMRVILDSAEDWLPQLRSGDAAALEPLVHNLRTYVDFVDRHIDMEEEVVFPMAAQYLSAADFEELSDAFAAIACEELEEGVHAYYSDLAHELAGAPHTAAAG